MTTYFCRLHFAAVAAFAVTALLMSAPHTAAAQDSEEETESDDSDESMNPPPREPSALLRRSVYDAGRWSLGIDGVFSRTSTSAEMVEQDGEMTDTTRFLRVDPWVSVGIVDQLHIGVVTGFVSRRLSTEFGDGTTENAFAFQPMAQYYIPVTPRLAIYSQLATGGYIGNSERTILDPDTEGELLEEEETSTIGFLFSAGLGLNYRLSEGLQIQFGLAFHGLWGSERVDATDDRLSTSTTNLGTTAGLRYTF